MSTATGRSRLDDFWSHVNKEGPIPAHKPELGPCWLWTTTVNGKGYGVYRMNGSLQYAHRIALCTRIGQLPSNRQACHDCDNPPCVNPEHLHPGTASMNLREAYRRKRRKREGAPPVARGEAHWKHKLTAELVRQIRAEYAAGTPQLKLAEKFGVNQSTIQRIVTGKAWAAIK